MTELNEASNGQEVTSKITIVGGIFVNWGENSGFLYGGGRPDLYYVDTLKNLVRKQQGGFAINDISAYFFDDGEKIGYEAELSTSRNDKGVLVNSLTYSPLEQTSQTVP